MTSRSTEAELRARFDLSQDDQTCMFSEHANAGKIPYAESELRAAWQRYYDHGSLEVIGMSVDEMDALAARPAAQTCMFSEHAHHVELANRDEQAGQECGGMDRFIVGLVVFAGVAIAVGVILARNLPRWIS